MVDHTEAWQLRIAIIGRLTNGTMTVEHLKAFLAMPRADLDRIFKTPESEGVTTTTHPNGPKTVYGKGPSVTETT